jgi:RimJ/RimL family protein N-acetyltransferase
MLKIRELKAEDMPKILEWRNKAPETLRTPYRLTIEQQMDWYKKEICNRESRTRYWAFELERLVDEHDLLVGYGGIENLIWEYKIGEISLLIGDEYQGKGYGTDAVKMIIGEGFGAIGLKNIWGECYECASPGFWKKIFNELEEKYDIYTTVLPQRKYYEWEYWNSLYFNIGVKDA